MLFIFVKCIVILISLVAVCMDLSHEKVKNQFLAFFWILALGYQIGMYGLRGVVFFLTGAGLPILLLYILFFFRMLGAGDIKLLSVLGGFIGPMFVIKCISVSFLAGAVISVFIILIYGNLVSRLKYFTSYISQLIITKEVVPYCIPGKRRENIHFTIPILISVLVYIGGLLG